MTTMFERAMQRQHSAISAAGNSIMLSYRIPETGTRQLGGDFSALRIGEALKALGYMIFTSGTATEGGQQWTQEIHNGVRDCHVFCAVCSPDYGNRDWALKALQMADSMRKKILPIWHSSSFPPEAVDMFLCGTQRVPRGNRPFVNIDFTQFMKELVTQLHSLQCRPDLARCSSPGGVYLMPTDHQLAEAHKNQQQTQGIMKAVLATAAMPISDEEFLIVLASKPRLKDAYQHSVEEEHAMTKEQFAKLLTRSIVAKQTRPSTSPARSRSPPVRLRQADIALMFSRAAHRQSLALSSSRPGTAPITYSFANQQKPPQPTQPRSPRLLPVTLHRQKQ